VSTVHPPTDRAVEIDDTAVDTAVDSGADASLNKLDPVESTDMWILQLSKHHGLGNDFLVLDDTDSFVNLTLEEGAALARQVCARHTGIGADGLLLGLAAPADGSADVTMRLHNADGSVAEMSGNGIRCFVQGLVHSGSVSDGVVTVMTDAGLREVSISSHDGGLGLVDVDMGMARIGVHPVHMSSALTTNDERRVLTVDVGNPHVVVDAAVTDGSPIGVFGPDAEAAYLSGPTRGINVEVISALGGGAGIHMDVWERGVGITQACGTGACAAAVVARRWGMAGDRVQVHQPGGSAEVVLSGDIDDNEVGVRLIGPTVHIADLEVIFRRG
jgi:diaminopimelate epimerase